MSVILFCRGGAEWRPEIHTTCRAKYTEPGMLNTGGLAGSFSPMVPMVRGSKPGGARVTVGAQKRRVGKKFLEILS